MLSMARLLTSLVLCFVCATHAFRVSYTDSAARAPNGSLLVCVDAKKGERLIISAADRAYWDYYYEIGQYYTQEGSVFGVRGAELEKYKSKLECWPLTKKVSKDFTCDTCKTSTHAKPELIQQCADAQDSSSFQAINTRVVDAGVYSACMLDETRIGKIESDIAQLEEKALRILEKDNLLDRLLEDEALLDASSPGTIVICSSTQTGKRLFFAADERSYWDYRYEKGEYFTQQRWGWSADALAKMKDKINCGGIPTSLLEDLKCDECKSGSMPSAEHLQQCASANTVEDFKRIQDEVVADGGNCLVGGTRSSGQQVTKCVKDVEQPVSRAAADSEARSNLEQIGAWLPAKVNDFDVQKVVDKLEDAKKRKTSCSISLEELFDGDHMSTSDGGLAAVKSKKNGHIFLFFLNSIIRSLRTTNPILPDTREPLTAEMIWPLTEGAAAVNAKTSASACIMNSHAENWEAHQKLVADIDAKKEEVAQLKSDAELYFA